MDYYILIDEDRNFTKVQELSKDDKTNINDGVLVALKIEHESGEQSYSYEIEVDIELEEKKEKLKFKG